MHMHVIEKTVIIAAPPAAVWDALTEPAAMRAWMGEPEMAIDVATDWRPGSAIVISGVHHGPFRNQGIVLDAVPGALLRYTHLSSVSALADVPAHYSVIAFALDAVDGGTALRPTPSTGTWTCTGAGPWTSSRRSSSSGQCDAAGDWRTRCSCRSSHRDLTL